MSLIRNLNKSIDAFLQKYGLLPLKGVALFMLITIAIHYSFRAWVRVGYVPMGNTMEVAANFMIDKVFYQSLWFNQHILGYDITPVDYTMYFAQKGYIHINEGCSGLKQFLQVGLLFLLFPGPWKKKLWFIPLGVFIMHLTNLFRIIGLSVVLLNWPDHWKFSHDYLFRPFFYVVIFSLWVWWVEKLSHKEPHTEAKTEVKG